MISSFQKPKFHHFHLLLLLTFCLIFLSRIKQSQAIYCYSWGSSQSQADIGCGGTERGTCISTDNCQCNPGYSGNRCQYYVCYGVSSSSGSVCSGRGSCTGADTCSCNSGYTGNNCQYYTCYGTASNDNPCSGNGVCTGVNTCSCDTGYTGDRCQYFTCNSISSSSVSVCSGHGNCFNVNQCQCEVGYGGQWCQYPICNSKRSDDATVCNSRGTCSSPNSCTCTDTNSHTGSDCEYLKCFGKSEIDPAVCTERAVRGYCTSVDTCTCTGLYSGTQCERTTCDGISSTSTSTVCSGGKGRCYQHDQCACFDDGLWGNKGQYCSTQMCNGKTIAEGACGSHGTCVIDADYGGINNTCSCDTGYAGTLCEDIICHGKITNQDLVSDICNGRGTCVSPDNCVNCDVGWVGSNCEVRQCNGKNYTDPTVCSSRGVCAEASHSCECHNGWRGVDCQIKTCSGFDYNQAGVCNGHGVCNPSGSIATGGNCTCNSGYGADDCSEWYCYGIHQSAQDVCSGHGTCADANQCSCQSTYGGSQCEIFSCYNTLASDSSVCSDHGQCNATDFCLCNTGWTDNNCDMPICYGVLANQSTVCNGHGSCTNPDQCICSTGFSGERCELTLCYDTYSNDPSVCSGHGSCTGPNQCSCSINWRDSQCQTPVCFGKRADDSTVCNGQGSCVSADTCVCNADPNTGWTGSNCENPLCFGDPYCSYRGNCSAQHTCTCSTGYTGQKCETPICYGVVATDTVQVCGGGKGICTSRDTCACKSYEFTGPQCTLPGCYGKNASDSLICGSIGNCTAVDTCQCPSGIGYLNSRCEPTTCFGQSFDNVCNGHGECRERDVCICSSGWTGYDCNIAICDGITSNLTTVCSSNENVTRGVCVAPETCTCTPGSYTGQFCQHSICWNVAGDSPIVCSGHGSCSAPNQCACDTGYEGINCQVSTCFGVRDDNSSVCSGRGTCVSKDLCVCTVPSVTGSNCEINICNAIRQDDSHVCNSRGNCTSPDLCTCIPQYGGALCEHPACFGVVSTDPSTCSGHGTCFFPDACGCEFGNYTGNNCQLAICYGYNASDASVCNGHGHCSLVDDCVCETSMWTGSTCNTPICYGIAGNNASVCSTHGSCDFANLCTCNNGWTGDLCDIPICYGLNATDTLVCSSNGTCVGPDNCTCLTGFTNGVCQLPVCFGYNSSESVVCSSHGRCISPEVCMCDYQHTGRACEFDICFDISSNDSSGCSGHGQCVEWNDCACHKGLYTGIECSIPICYNKSLDNETCSNHGQCSSPDNCTCDAGWTGEQCEIPVCFGNNATDPMVCSGRGVCSFKDTCICKRNTFLHHVWDYDFLGPNCQVPVCFTQLATDPLVCSGRGSCDSPNSCNCTAPYSGSNCQLEGCFGLSTTDPMVCSGRGDCLLKDVCLCTVPSTIGSQCELNICNYINSSVPEVCSTHGQCTGPEQCTCDEGWTGPDCQFYVCTNASSNSSSVCSGHGNCTYIETCECDPRYTGPNCQFPICFGLDSTNTSVCSGHGDCVAPNHCECLRDPFFNELVWNGTLCNETAERFCFGKSIVDPTVCSTHGVCEFDRCECDAGWISYDCRYPTCFGKSLRTAEPPCSGRGTCGKPDNCTCIEGYGGADCSVVLSNFTCFGAASNDSRVCSSHGNCVSSDTCVCSEGYEGVLCENINCFGGSTQYGAFAVCAGKGECISPNQCLCESSAVNGSQCQQWQCFGVFNNDTSVCSGRGECTASDSCLCNEGWMGSSCASQTCYCSGHGTCSDPGVCSCITGYSGSQCEEWNCFGISRQNTSSVCSSHGECASLDACTCSQGYGGDSCDIISCYDKIGDDACSTGSCVAPNRCTCPEGFTGRECQVNISLTCPSESTCVCPRQGMDPSTRCQSCRPGYYPQLECTQYCAGCNGHGSCSSEGSCFCIQSSVHGFWDESSNCSTCVEGFFGSACTQARFTWSATGDSLSALLVPPPDALIPTRVECQHILGSSTLAFLGDNPYCYWESSTSPPNSRLTIRLSNNPKILPFTNKRVEIDVTGKKIYVYVDIQTPSVRVSPQAVIHSNAYTGLGSCQDLVLQSYSVVSDSGKDLEYAWRSTSGFLFDGINEYMDQNNLASSSQLVLPYFVDNSNSVTVSNQTVLMQREQTYNFSLMVTSQFGGVDTKTISVVRGFNPKMSVSISGYPEQQWLTGETITLYGHASFDDTCISPSEQFPQTENTIIYRWTQIAGRKIDARHIRFSSNGRVLTISPDAFLHAFIEQESEELAFELSAQWIYDSRTESSTKKTLIINPKPVELINLSLDLQPNQKLDFDVFENIARQLIVSNFDETRFVWGCTNCFPALVTVTHEANTAQRRILTFDTFQISSDHTTVVFANVVNRKTFKKLKMQVELKMSPSAVASPYILPLTRRFIAVNDEPIIIEASVLSGTLKGAALEWKVHLLDPETKTVVHSLPSSLSHEYDILNQYPFALKTSSLLQNHFYRVELTINSQSTTSCDIFVAPIIKSGLFQVSPQYGVAMETPFKLEALFFESSTFSARLYSFGYRMPDTNEKRYLVRQSRESTHNEIIPISSSALTVFAEVEDPLYGSAQYQELIIATAQLQVSPVLNVTMSEYGQLAAHYFRVMVPSSIENSKPEEVWSGIETVATFMNSRTTIPACAQCTNTSQCPCEGGFVLYDCMQASEEEFEARYSVRASLANSLIQSSLLPSVARNGKDSATLLKLLSDIAFHFEKKLLTTVSELVELLVEVYPTTFDLESLTQTLSTLMIGVTDNSTYVRCATVPDVSFQSPYQQAQYTQLSQLSRWVSNALTTRHVPGMTPVYLFQNAFKFAVLSSSTVSRVTMQNSHFEFQWNTVNIVTPSRKRNSVSTPERYTPFSILLEKIAPFNVFNISIAENSTLVTQVLTLNTTSPTDQAEVQLIIPAEIDNSDLTFNLSNPGKIVVCKALRSVYGAGSTQVIYENTWNNCTTVSFNSSFVTCKCSLLEFTPSILPQWNTSTTWNALTFSAFTEQWIPLDLPVFGPPIVVVTPVVIHDFTTTISVSTVIGIYIFGLLLINCVEGINNCRLNWISKKIARKSIQDNLNTIDNFFENNRVTVQKSKLQRASPTSSDTVPDSRHSKEGAANPPRKAFYSDDDSEELWRSDDEERVDPGVASIIKSSKKKGTPVHVMKDDESDPVTPRGDENEYSDEEHAKSVEPDHDDRLREMIRKAQYLDDLREKQNASPIQHDDEQDQHHEEGAEQVGSRTHNYFVNILQPHIPDEKKEKSNGDDMEFYEPDIKFAPKPLVSVTILVQQVFLSHIWLGLLYLSPYIVGPTNSLISSYYSKSRHFLSKQQRLTLVFLIVSTVMALNTLWYSLHRIFGSEDVTRGEANFVLVGVLSAMIPAPLVWWIYVLLQKIKNSNYTWQLLLKNQSVKVDVRSNRLTTVKQTENALVELPRGISSLSLTNSHASKNRTVVPEGEEYAKDLLMEAKYRMDTVHLKSGLITLVGITLLCALLVGVGGWATSETFYWSESAKYVSTCIFIMTFVLIYVSALFLTYVWAKMRATGVSRRTLVAQIAISLAFALVLFCGFVTVVVLFSVKYNDEFFSTGLPFAIIGTVGLVYLCVLFLGHTVVQCLPLHLLSKLKIIRETVLSDRAWIPRIFLPGLYVLIYVWCTACLFLTVYFGLFLEEDAIMWLYSTLISIGTDIVVISPTLFLLWHSSTPVMLLFRMIFFKTFEAKIQHDKDSKEEEEEEES